MTTLLTPYNFDTSKMAAQKQFMESKAEWLMYSGAFGAGKSRVGCEKGHFLSLKYPGNRGAILRKTFASLRITTMDTYFRYVCPPDQIAANGFNRETHMLTLVNGSEILFIGLDKDTKIGSLELGWAFVDEAIEVDEDIWIMLDGRLRLNTVPFHQLMCATNPASTSHYLYKSFYESGDPEHEVVEANTLENPYLPDSYKSKLNKYTGRYRERYVLGKWVGFEGLVYENADLHEMIIPPFKLPENWIRFRSIDFGYSNPFVCQWWAEVPKDDEYDFELDQYPLENCDCLPGTLDVPITLHHYSRCLHHSIKGFYLYREIYMTRRIVELHATDILRFKETVLDTFADHDAEDRATLEEHGVITSLGNKEISLGIQTVTRMIDEDKVHIFEGCLVEVDAYLEGIKRPVRTAQEFGNYRWRPNAENTNQKEVPLGRDDHGMDAMRYLFHSLFGHETFAPEVIYKLEPKGKDNLLLIGERDWGSMLNRRNWRTM